ncbi:MAG TPA: class I SAM-dependent methyltransferase [Syntrophales bacterium]|nr:class I SAM-dependent methyltransferase [Syntrophales bacterium]HNS53330.1 class I SAM-dependent methyltransferase [Syntrophales bacterium]
MTTPEIFDDVWQHGHYREGSCAKRMIPHYTKLMEPGATINDYGSGTGRAEVELIKMGFRVNMVDFSAVALEDEARALVDGDRLTFTLADLAALPADFPVADWGISIGVMMTVDPAKLDTICREIRRTCRNLWVETYDTPDIRRGRDFTTIHRDGKWWAAKLAEFWPHVEAHPSPEHKRRAITICRSDAEGGRK